MYCTLYCIPVCALQHEAGVLQLQVAEHELHHVVQLSVALELGQHAAGSAVVDTV